MKDALLYYRSGEFSETSPRITAGRNITVIFDRQTNTAHGQMGRENVSEIVGVGRTPTDALSTLGVAGRISELRTGVFTPGANARSEKPMERSDYVD